MTLNELLAHYCRGDGVRMMVGEERPKNRCGRCRAQGLKFFDKECPHYKSKTEAKPCKSTS